MRFNKNIGIGADSIAARRIYMEMAAGDDHGLWIDQMTNPYTGLTSLIRGINIERAIKTPSGDFGLASIAFDTHHENYVGLKNITETRTIQTAGAVLEALVYGDFEGTIAPGWWGNIDSYGFKGVILDQGKDLSAGNTHRHLYGGYNPVRNESQINKSSGEAQISAYGQLVDIDLLPTLVAGTLISRAYGFYADVLGNAAGDSIAYGVYTKVSGADKNYGYYSENPSLRLLPITDVPTDVPDEGTCRFFGPPGGPYKIYIYLDGSWRDIVGLVAHDKTYHIVPSLPDAEVITDAQHGTRGSGLHADSHARLHALDSALDHSGAITAAQHGVFTTGDLHQDYLLASGARALTGGLPFALNQALEMVLEKRTTDPGLREYQNTGDTTEVMIYGDTWAAQTFTPSLKHTIKKVRLKLAKVGNPTWTLTIGIRATSAGKPVGSDLCSGTLDSSTLTTTPTWYDISLGAGTLLQANTQYAIVVRLAGGDINNYVAWRAGTGSPYPGGTYVASEDGGATWSIWATYDLMFEEYADIEGGIWLRIDLDRVSYSPDGLTVWRVPKSIDGIDVDSHASRHHSGGADPLALASIAGIITDAQHGSRGSGLHADSHVRLHALDSALDHSGVITDAQHGSRGSGLHADSHPQLHKDSHKSGGGDAFLSTDLLEAIIKRIQESSGPTNLTVGAIADGEYLKRSGSSIVGAVGVGAHNLLSDTHPDTLPASPTWGDILFANSDGKWARKALGTAGYYLMVGVGEPTWSLAPVERLRATADQSTTGTAFVNSTYLVFDAPANARILFMFYVIFQTAAVTTGIKLSVNCPSGYVICCYNTRIPTSTSAWTFGMQRAPNTGVATTGIDLANTNTLAIVEGVLITGATAGTLCLSFASEVSGSSVTIKAGSIGLISRVI